MAKVAARDTYLFECSPFDPSTGATVTVRRGTEAWTTAAGDTPATTTYAPGMKIQGFGASILDASSQMFAGFVEMDAGKLDLPMARQADGSYDGDDLLRYAWNGYAFTIYKIAKGALFSAKTTYLVGFVTGAAASEAGLQLTITSKNATLAAKQIQETKFWGRKYGLRFTNGQTHYVTMGDNLDQTDSFSVEILLRPASTPGAGTYRYPMSKWDGTGGGRGYYFTHEGNGLVGFEIWNGGVQEAVYTASAVAHGSFAMVSGVFDNSANTLSIYVNGVLSNTESGVSIAAGDSSAALLLGAEDTSGGDVFDGDIAEVRIWNVARSAEEIADSLYGGFHGVPVGLVGWYKFGEGTGTTLGDSSESPVNGTITGATWIGTYEGEESLAGIAKPWAIGPCLKREPILIDSAKLIYALCDRGLGDDAVGDYPNGRPQITDGGLTISEDTSSGSGAGAQTYYLYNTTATGSSHGKMDTTAPSAVTTGTGWTVGTKGSGQYSLMVWGTERADTTFGATAMPNTTPTTTDCWRSESVISGIFAAGTWSITAAVRAVTTESNHYGRARCRIYKSANANGSAATEITSATAVGSSTGNMNSRSLTFTSTISATGAETTFTSEYLFVQIAWECLTASGTSTTDVLLRTGSDACRVVSTSFNSGGTLPDEDLWATTVATSKFKYDATRGNIRLGTAPVYRLAASFCGAAYDGDSTGLPLGQIRAVVEESAGFADSAVSVTNEDFFSGPEAIESGIHVPAGNATCLDILRRIHHNYRSSGGFQSDGIYRARAYTNAIVSALTPAFAYTQSDVIRGSFQVIAALDPIREVLVKYAPYQPAHGPAEIAGAVSQSDRFDLQREFRRAFKTRATDRDGRAWSNHREGARKIVIETDLTADWMLAYTIPPLLDVFDTQVMVAQFQLTTGSTSKKPTIGDLVTMTFPRFGFDAGVECLVTGVEESQPGNRITVQIMDATTLAEA